VVGKLICVLLLDVVKSLCLKQIEGDMVAILNANGALSTVDNLGAETEIGGGGGKVIPGTTHSPLALYNFDDASGDDSSGNSRNLTLTGPSSDRAAGYYGTCWRQSGTNRYSRTDAALRLTGAMSAWAIIKPITTIGATLQTIITHGASGETAPANILYSLGLKNNTLDYLHESAAGTDQTGNPSNVLLSLHEWVFIGFTRDSLGTTINFFVNGGNVGFNVLGAAPNDGSSGSMYIGSWVDGSEAFNGNIQTVKIMNTELTDAEMLAEYRAAFGISV
jgi:hypothetical protein